MQEASRLAYAVSHILALSVCSFTGFWRQLPICYLMIATSSVIAVTYNPESRGWIRDVYLNIEPLAVILRFMSAVEAIRCQTQGIRKRALLIDGLLLAAVSVTAAVWTIEPSGDTYTFVQLRRYGQIATAVFMIAGAAFLWSQRLWKWNQNGYHSAILLALTIKQATYSLLSIRGLWPTNRQWHTADWPGLLISSLCFLGWAALSAVFRQRPEDCDSDQIAYR